MKKSLFSIDDSERQRILEMHQSATKKQYLGEQVAPATTPATAPGPKDPASFVKSVVDIAINKDANSKLLFKSPSMPNGITFTTKVSKVPDGKDPKTGAIIPGVYTIILQSNSLDIRFDFTCGSGPSFVKSTIKEKGIIVQNPMQNNRTYRDQEIDRLLVSLNGLDRDITTEANPFLAEFKQQFCS